MKKIILALTILATVSCSSARVSRAYSGINPEFEDSIENFIYDSNGKVTREDFIDLSMGFYSYPKGEDTVGTCWSLGYMTEIDISKKDWDNHHSPLWRKELTYHEFGHCILGRNHTEITTSSGFVGAIERFFFRIGWWQPRGYLSDGCPVSLMHPRMIGDYCFEKHFKYYIEELFANYNPAPKYDSFDSDFGLSFDMVNEGETHPPFLPENKLKKMCGDANVINKTSTWNKRDQGTLDRAYQTCPRVYGSCLKTFTKTSQSSYRVICGGQ